jgi:hypothetical protein
MVNNNSIKLLINEYKTFKRYISIYLSLNRSINVCEVSVNKYSNWKVLLFEIPAHVGNKLVCFY